LTVGKCDQKIKTGGDGIGCLCGRFFTRRGVQIIVLGFSLRAASGRGLLTVYVFDLDVIVLFDL
jgi:hypothetical protein